MTLNNKGDTGFQEAILATSVVCIVATSFIAFAVTQTDDYQIEKSKFEWYEINGMKITSGEYQWKSPEDLSQLCSKYGIKGIIVTAKPNGIQDINESKWEFGIIFGEQKTYNRLFDIDSDDTRIVPTTVTVQVFE